MYAFFISAYIFLVIEGFSLEKAERKFNGFRELKIIAIIILIWFSIKIFVPFIETTNPTIFESSFVAIYTTTMYLFIHSGIFQLLLGILFVIFGHKNRENYGFLILIGGIIYLISIIFNTLFNFIIEVYSSLEFLSWMFRSLFLIYAIIILTYSILIKRIFFILFGTFLLVAEIISFCMFFGIL